MASPTPKAIPIRIEVLAPFYANLARALTEAGITGGQLNAALSTRLRASCVRCDIHLTTAEIEQMSLVEDPAQLAHPKLKRLRLGYCARDGCESDAYQIHLEACPGVDWEIIVAKANDLMSAQKAAEKEAVRRQERRKRIQRSKRAILALLTVAACLLLLFVWRQGRLPFVKKPHKYQIDPASVSPGPRR